MTDPTFPERPVNWLRCIALIDERGIQHEPATGVVFPDGIIVLHRRYKGIEIYPDEQACLEALRDTSYRICVNDIEVPLEHRAH